MSLEATITVTVPFHDVDPAGRVWHGNYFRYYESARCQVLDRLSYNYRQMAASGVIWPLTDVQSRFHAPIAYHDRIDVTARLVEWEYRLLFRYHMHDAEQRLLATARTVQVPVAMDSGELLIGSPDRLVRQVEAHLSDD